MHSQVNHYEHKFKTGWKKHMEDFKAFKIFQKKSKDEIIEAVTARTRENDSIEDIPLPIAQPSINLSSVHEELSRSINLSICCIDFFSS